MNDTLTGYVVGISLAASVLILFWMVHTAVKRSFKKLLPKEYEKHYGKK
jgi:uncharacterized membrane protein